MIDENRYDYVNDIIIKNLNSIDNSIDECNTKLDYLRSCESNSLDESINNLEVNLNILRFKEMIINNFWNDDYSRNSLLFYIMDRYEHYVYGFAYNRYLRKQKYIESNTSEIEDKVHRYLCMELDNFFDLIRFKSHIYDLDNLDKIEDIELRENLENIKRIYGDIRWCACNPMLRLETVDEMVDDIFALNIDNLEEYVDNDTLLDLMCKENIIKDRDKFTNKYEALFSTFYERYDHKYWRISRGNTTDNKIIKTKKEVIVSMFYEDGPNYIYDDDEIKYFSKCFDLNELNVDIKNNKVKGYK